MPKGINARKKMLDFIEQQLIGGGIEGPDKFDEIEYPPYKHYLMGVLWPQDDEDGEDNIDPDEIDDSEIGTGEEDSHASGISSAYNSNPAALGISFFVGPDTKVINVLIDASIYEGDPENQQPWTRKRLSSIANDAPYAIPIGGPTQQQEILDGRAKITAISRPYANGQVVTVALVNLRRVNWCFAQERSNYSYIDPQDHLYQVRIRCTPDCGSFETYPGDRTKSWDAEEDELHFLYRKRKAYAAGHGVSVDWEESDKPSWVQTEHLPQTKVKDVTFDVPLTTPDILKWQRLADPTTKQSVVCDELSQFVTDYECWIQTLDETTFKNKPDFERSAASIKERLLEAHQRMSDGVALLRSNKEWYRAFRLANEAVLMQRIHLREAYAGSSHEPSNPTAPPKNYFDPSLASDVPLTWRPFQLAFILLVIPSLIDPQRNDRDVVDLLWFPTGGGKTEAYLGLTAFEIFRRRIMDGPAGCGTAAIKRYTYRVLTHQQFERASTLICACDSIRKREADLEDDPISIGLWVGGDVTPNKYKDAIAWADETRCWYQQISITKMSLVRDLPHW